MEQNTDRMGFALIALAVVAAILLLMNTVFAPTVETVFKGLKTWSENSMGSIKGSTFIPGK